jgi:hypothetical protein
MDPVEFLKDCGLGVVSMNVLDAWMCERQNALSILAYS